MWRFLFRFIFYYYMPNRVLDTLKKDELYKIAKEKLNLLVTKSMTKAQIKEIVSKELNKKGPMKYVFPKVPVLIVIGDLHGDLEATIKALKMARVIDMNLPNETKDIRKINWKGGKTVVVQLGDQIDRVRPANLVNSLCPEDDEDLVRDEGSDLKIMLLFSKLANQASQVGGAVYSILGNHELMNVDGDFRYVSPKEFREFGNYFKEPRNSDNRIPYGYISRKRAFAPGGTLAKHLASDRHSVLVVGSWLFVHGGITPQIASNFLLKDINLYIRRWLDGAKDTKTMAYVNSVYHNDDENFSPFWTREFSDLEEWNPMKHNRMFDETIGLINKNNKLNVKGMVVGHSPQFNYSKGLNSACNNRLWRADVGMSKAFGECDDKNRCVQILVIKNDTEFIILKENP